jgi:hypothetical protein
VGFFGEFVGVIRVLQCSFRMPLSGFVVPFFIVFRGGAMGFRRKFMLLSGFPVCVVHFGVFPSSLSSCTTRTNPFRFEKSLGSITLAGYVR